MLPLCHIQESLHFCHDWGETNDASGSRRQRRNPLEHLDWRHGFDQNKRFQIRSIFKIDVLLGLAIAGKTNILRACLLGNFRQANDTQKHSKLCGQQNTSNKNKNNDIGHVNLLLELLIFPLKVPFNLWRRHVERYEKNG